MSIRDNYNMLNIIKTYSNQPVIRVNIPSNPYKIEKEEIGETSTYRMTHEFAIQIADKVEEATLKAICSMAREAGLNEVIVLNKEFILTALQNEIKRREADKPSRLDEIEEAH